MQAAELPFNSGLNIYICDTTNVCLAPQHTHLSPPVLFSLPHSATIMPGSQLSSILSQWDGPVFDDSRTSDVYKWLDEIEKGCVKRSIPSDNWPQVAIYFMSGNVKPCMQKLYDSRETWKWEDFKKFLIHIDGELSGVCFFLSLLMRVFCPWRPHCL